MVAEGATIAADMPTAAGPPGREGEPPALVVDRVVRRLGLGYHLGNAVERIAAAAGKEEAGVDDLREAAWLIERYIDLVESWSDGEPTPG